VILFGCHDGRDGVVVDDYRRLHSIHIGVVVVVVVAQVKSLERQFEGFRRWSGVLDSNALRDEPVVGIGGSFGSWKSARKRVCTHFSSRYITLHCRVKMGRVYDRHDEEGTVLLYMLCS
jgi:hypothetical protein